MALQKTKRVKGVDCNYRSITESSWNKKENKTEAVLSLFVDILARQESIDNYICKESMHISGGPYTAQEMYTKIKEPVLIKNYATSFNEDGTSNTVVTSETNINFFSDALDV